MPKYPYYLLYFAYSLSASISCFISIFSFIFSSLWFLSVCRDIVYSLLPFSWNSLRCLYMQGNIIERRTLDFLMFISSRRQLNNDFTFIRFYASSPSRLYHSLSSSHWSSPSVVRHGSISSWRAFWSRSNFSMSFFSRDSVASWEWMSSVSSSFCASSMSVSRMFVSENCCWRYWAWNFSSSSKSFSMIFWTSMVKFGEWVYCLTMPSSRPWLISLNFLSWFGLSLIFSKDYLSLFYDLTRGGF